ncbi:hypothetical protein TELCIR_09381, partial [Teladorsagia circumcincta]
IMSTAKPSTPNPQSVIMSTAKPSTPNPQSVVGIAKVGSGSATRVFSSFPTVTFPNHYTMVTGEHPGHHGLVSNTIYDTEVAEKPLYLGKNLLDGFYLKEPIWSVYKKATKRKAATFSWIGSYHDSTRQSKRNIRQCDKKNSISPTELRMNGAAAE